MCYFTCNDVFSQCGNASFTEKSGYFLNFSSATSVLKLEFIFPEQMSLFLSGVHGSKASSVKVCRRCLYLCSVSIVRTRAC